MIEIVHLTVMVNIFAAIKPEQREARFLQERVNSAAVSAAQVRDSVHLNALFTI